MTARAAALALAVGLATAACGSTPHARTPSAPQGNSNTVVISVVGTSDLHGHIEALPVLAGYVEIVRRERAHDGAVLLLDGGDLFQGTLESNLGEGDSVVAGYNALGYAAAAVGNHEFDFGPAGPLPTPHAPGDDPQGALRARAHEALFTFLLANTALANGQVFPSEIARPSEIVDLHGVHVGIVGVTSEDTPRTTASANVSNLRFDPPAEAIVDEAAALRREGATVIVVVAHAGGRCTRFDNPDDVSSCDPDAEIFSIARALPRGTVDVIVAGHTHAAIAHRVAGIPVIQSYAQGRAFGRVDLTVDTASGRVVSSAIHPPRDLCDAPPSRGPCHPGVYDGAVVLPDAAIARTLEPAFARARSLRETPLGVTLPSPIARGYERESALGDLLADLLLASRPGADVAVLNAGGIRADLPAGPLTYGALFEALPFDNKVTTVRMTAGALAALVARSLGGNGGIVCTAGVRAAARCENGAMRVALARADGTPLRDDTPLTVLTTDFLASGGDGYFGRLSPEEFQVDDAHTLRDAIVDVLRARPGTLAARTESAPRLVYPGERPVRCASP